MLETKNEKITFSMSNKYLLSAWQIPSNIQKGKVISLCVFNHSVNLLFIQYL